MKIALVSLNQIWEDKEANKTRCQTFIKKAANSNAEIVIFPEMTLTGFSMNIMKIAEEPEIYSTKEFFVKQAIKYNINIVFGMVTSNHEKALNHSIFVSTEGSLKTIYSKIHPFSFAGENKYFNSGSDLGIIDYLDSKIGLTICYDLRFPELYQALSKESEIIINIANWPAKRIDHWISLLKARAIENQVYMVGVNRTGKDGNGLEYVKSSIIFDPEGKELKSFVSSTEFDLFKLDISKVKVIRNNFPVKQDRRIELYKEIL